MAGGRLTEGRMAGKWREGKWPEENTAVVQTKEVLEANFRAGGFSVQLAEQEGDWPKVTGSWGFLDPQDRYDH